METITSSKVVTTDIDALFEITGSACSAQSGANITPCYPYFSAIEYLLDIAPSHSLLASGNSSHEGATAENLDRVWCRRSICSMEQKRAAIETYIRLDYCGADTIAEFAYGCSHLEAALDIELDRPCPLFRSAHVILQTSLFGADFRYYPQPATARL